MRHQDHNAAGEDKALGRLLDSLPQPVPPRNFPDAVMRRIRLEVSEENVGWLAWFAQAWKPLIGLAGCAALLASAIIFQQDHAENSSIATNEAPDISALLATLPPNSLALLSEVETSLDDNDIWLGSDSY